jgi:hypothetical protein
MTRKENIVLIVLFFCGFGNLVGGLDFTFEFGSFNLTNQLNFAINSVPSQPSGFGITTKAVNFGLDQLCLRGSSTFKNSTFCACTSNCAAVLALGPAFSQLMRANTFYLPTNQLNLGDANRIDISGGFETTFRQYFVVENIAAFTNISIPHNLGWTFGFRGRNIQAIPKLGVNLGLDGTGGFFGVATRWQTDKSGL